MQSGPHNKPCVSIHVCLSVPVYEKYILCVLFAGVSVFFFFTCEQSSSSSVSLLYLSILRAGADRADVDNYKVFSQRANFRDVCLPLSLFLSPHPLLPLLWFGRFSGNHNATEPKCNLQVGLCMCVFAVLVFPVFWLQLCWYISFGYPSFQLCLDTHSHTLNYPHPRSHAATSPLYKPMFCSGLRFKCAPMLHSTILHFSTLSHITDRSVW